jgi:D-Tyr-tRNAtyr deacylase
MLMSDQNNNLNHFLTTIDAAKILKLSPRTLERMRVEGGGPPFLKAGPGKRSRVLYRYQDLIDWLAPRSYGSTSEYPKV